MNDIREVPGVVIIEGHVQGLSNARALGERGIPVIVVDKAKGIAAYSKYCRRFFRCPDFGTGELASFLLNLGRKEKLDGWMLLPSNDLAVLTLVKHRKELEEMFKLTVPNLEVFERIYDKSQLLDVAERVCVPIPQTWLLRSGTVDVIPARAYPVITKGRNGLTFYRKIGSKALFARSPAELRMQLAEIEKKMPLDKTFTQEVIPFDGSNRTVSFTAFCINGTIMTHWTGVKVREHPLQFGTATLAKSIHVPECYAQSSLLLRELNFTGVCEVEYLCDPRDGLFKLIEINSRTWLWVGLARACGVDYANLLYNFANGEGIDWPETYPDGVSWINPITDLVYGIKGIFSGRYSIREYLNSFGEGRMVNDLIVYGDMKPGIAYMLNLMRFLKNR